MLRRVRRLLISRFPEPSQLQPTVGHCLSQVAPMQWCPPPAIRQMVQVEPVVQVTVQSASQWMLQVAPFSHLMWQLSSEAGHQK
jgi:hypothetical protein